MNNIKFNIGIPFKPFTQLMGVLPAESGKIVLPDIYHDLMINAKSPIIDFYPKDFKLDLNGKRMKWQAIAILPFIDENRLLNAIKPLENKLTIEQKKMNSEGNVWLFCSKKYKLNEIFNELRKMDIKEDDNLIGNRIKIDYKIAEECNLFGYLKIDYENNGKYDKDILKFVYELPKEKQKNMQQNNEFGLLKGSKIHQKELTKFDAQRIKNKIFGDNFNRNYNKFTQLQKRNKFNNQNKGKNKKNKFKTYNKIYDLTNKTKN